MSDWLGGSFCERAIGEVGGQRVRRGLSILASGRNSTAHVVGAVRHRVKLRAGRHRRVRSGQHRQGASRAGGAALIMTALRAGGSDPGGVGYNALVRGNQTVLGRLNPLCHDLHAYFITGAPLALNTETGCRQRTALRRAREATKMAMGRGFRRQRRRNGEINMTPLVDVMLVLLIIFIITVPVLTHGQSWICRTPPIRTRIEKPETVQISITATARAALEQTPSASNVPANC